MTNPLNGPALIFLHVPKTAGTTLNRIIEWQYDPRLIYTIDPHRIRATAKRLETLPEERRRRLRCVRGHLAYGIHDYLPQGGSYITMLRDPIARFFSTYYFILRRPLHPLHRKLRTKGVGIDDFLELTVERQNMQTMMIAGGPFVEPCNEQILEKAKQNLTRSFRVVGISERFQDSLLLIASSFGWTIPHYENRKVSKGDRPAHDPAMLEKVREHNRYDIELYEFGKQRLEDDLRRNREVIAQTALGLESRPKPGKAEQFTHSTLGAGRFLLSKLSSAL
jgi:sulfotransferase famil protein